MKLSIVIPNRNMAGTIGKCVKAALASEYADFEVVVVDDNSSDGSLEALTGLPCKVISLRENAGAAKARNVGAGNSSGEILFFTDADCILQKDTLSKIKKRLQHEGPGAVIGGTYTLRPFDRDFFSRFQSVFINYSETKNAAGPDYIATHAMGIHSADFKKSGGFPHPFLPMLEDVEFSHRIKREGSRLIMCPDITVQHIFNFSFLRSISNAFRKSKFWVMYSVANKDLTADSGCASSELKFNAISFVAMLSLLMMWRFAEAAPILYAMPVILILNIISSRRLITAFHKAGGAAFAFNAVLYWIFIYPIPVGAGAIFGLLGRLIKR